ncbi:putative neurogenic locus Notch protein-like, partial [Apostichopus japonicus]
LVPEQVSSRHTFFGEEIALSPWVLLLLALFALLILFVIGILLIALFQGRTEHAKYDAERAKRERIRGLPNSQLGDPIPTPEPEHDEDDEDTTGDYGFVPFTNGGTTVAELNAFDNPWPDSTEDFTLAKTAL